jgi:hypothetical protein
MIAAVDGKILLALIVLAKNIINLANVGLVNL